MSYTPKVGDVIKVKNSSTIYTLVFVVNNTIGYTNNKGDSVYATNNFEDSFNGDSYIFPKEKFTPEKGDKCYYPLYDYSEDSKYASFDWLGNMGINRQHAMLASGLLFKTSEEAIEARDKMIASLQN